MDIGTQYVRAFCIVEATTTYRPPHHRQYTQTHTHGYRHTVRSSLVHCRGYDYVQATTPQTTYTHKHTHTHTHTHTCH